MEYWRLCSSCKGQINFHSKYYECSVSTCNGKRTGYVFCSVPCFERHLPGARHRSAGAIEKVSPTLQNWTLELAQNPSQEEVPLSSGPVRRIIKATTSNVESQFSKEKVGESFGGHLGVSKSSEDEILIVVSKLKNYIRDLSEMNTAGDVPEILSHFVRRLCDGAIEEARKDGRKTVMARDFQKNSMGRS